MNQDIYYIFEDTGFINIMNVKKALRSISLDGCEKIYSGSHSDFYRLNSETTLKVYKGEYNSPEKIEQNRLIAKTVFIHGIPSVIPFDMVKAGWTKRAMGLGEDVLVPLWNTIIESYLGNEYSDKIPEVNRVLRGYGMLKSILGLAATSSIPEDVKVERITRMKKALFSVIDTLYPIP